MGGVPETPTKGLEKGGEAVVGTIVKRLELIPNIGGGKSKLSHRAAAWSLCPKGGV